MPSKRCGFTTGPRGALRQCTRYDGHEDGCTFDEIEIDPDHTDPLIAAERESRRPKTRNEIEAEKAAKPRPDLLPPSALAMTMGGNVGAAFTYIAQYLRARELPALGAALNVILDLLVYCNAAKSRADAIMQAGEIMGVGLRKHGPCTWRIAGTEQADPQCHYASLVRHLLEYEDGITQDPDSGRHPLLHAVCQISIMINLLDDPPEYPDDNDGRAMIGRPK